MYIAGQLPNVLRLWLGPTADGQAFLPPRLRASLLKVLMALPVQKAHLRDSGIGKLVVAMAADPEETEENRELIKQVGRMIALKANVRLVVEGCRQRLRILPRAPMRKAEVVRVSLPEKGYVTSTLRALVDLLDLSMCSGTRAILRLQWDAEYLV